MIIGEIDIYFGIDKPTPYFQVSDEYRIRFGYERMKGSLIKQIVEDTFSNETISMEFLLQIKEDQRIYKEKTNLARYFKIKNWKEVFHKGEEEVDYVNAIVKGIDQKSLIKYITKVICGHEKSSYIIFFSSDKLIYVSADVIDIVSFDTAFIERLKEKYKDSYDMYHVLGGRNDN